MDRPLLAVVSILSAASLAGCGGAHSTLRFGRDGEPERFIDCSGAPMSRCYERALADCPQGYRLVEESQTPAGNKNGSIFGGVKHVGGTSSNSEVTFKNQIVIRCKEAPAPAGPTTPLP